MTTETIAATFKPSGPVVAPYQPGTLLPAMPAQPHPVEAPLSETSIKLALNAEIMNDLDTGAPTLVASTTANEGDVRQVSPARLRTLTRQARRTLDRFEGMADRYESGSAPHGPAPEAPRTWTFTDSDTDKAVTLTCMTGCELDHARDIATSTHPEDIWCQAHSDDVWLPVDSTGTPEECRVLSATMNVKPFSPTFSERLPHVSVEVVMDHWISGLDPDGLSVVIDTMAERLDMLRHMHAQLTEVRAEYRGRK